MTSKLGFLVVAAVILGEATPGWAEGSLTATFTTTPSGGNYAPKNVVAVWVEGPGGTFVKTIGRWAGTRREHLVAWTAAAGAADVDAVSGATRASHTAPLTVTWDLLDRTNVPVPDGTYTLRMELADENATQAAQNNQGTFTFVKGPQPSTQTALSSGGFINVSVTFNADAGSCNNGVVDAGETCDGDCPTTCEASADACAPNVLVGAAATCSAACMAQPIDTCINGDGCCPDACDDVTDDDCGASGGADAIEGGCAAAGSSGEALSLGGLGLLGLFGLRRRRRSR